MTYREDISNQQAEATDAALAERMYRNEWPEDETPTRAELDREEFWRGRERCEEYWGAGE